MQRWVKQLAERDRRREPVSFVPVRLVERAPEQRNGVEIVVGKWVVRVRRSRERRSRRAAMRLTACSRPRAAHDDFGAVVERESGDCTSKAIPPGAFEAGSVRERGHPT